MNATPLYLRDLVAVDADFKPSVQLPFDFESDAINERLIQSFIPTSQSIEILSELARSMDPNSTERARTLVGTFGTGKSDLLLMICNYFAHRVDDPRIVPFYERLRNIDLARAGMIRTRREGRPPYLIVLLQADTVTSFPGFVLHGLQHALEKAGLAHLMSKTRYSAAREQILLWQREGHARYADFCKLLQEHEEREITSLLAELNGPQAGNALPLFLRTFKAVTGADFNVYGYSQPHEAYATVAEALVASGDYSGILLVCDEFTAFMERFQNAIDQQLREVDSETKAVENLAERSGSSGRAQIHFIVASLESFASAAGTIGSRSVADATERIGGRFKQHSLQVQGSEELIRGAIRRLDPGCDLGLPNSQRDDLLQTASEIWIRQGREREWIRDTIVEGSFPLHPISTYALPLINQRVAQSQRTMFLFLNDPAGLRGFIQREPLQEADSGWARLLTPDRLFDYFRESIATKRSEVTDAYDLGEQRLRSVTINTELAERVLKITALCETVGSDLVLRPTRLFLRRALNLPPGRSHELDEVLKLLEELDAIEAPSEIESSNGIFRLPMRGFVSVKSLHRRITNRAQNLAPISVEKLQARYPAQAVVAADYNRKRHSHRKLSAYYVSVATLRLNHRLKADLEAPQNRDALLWYVVATTDAERSEAQSLARELTEQQPRLVVAVSAAPSSVLSVLRDYQALEDLRRDPELEQVNKPYLEDSGRVGREYRQRLDEELKKLADARQWEWFAAGRGSSGLNKADLDRLVNAIMEKVFSDTPNTGLQQHFKPDDLGNTIMRAVAQMIKGEIKLDRGAKGAIDNVLKTGAVTLGLLQAEGTSGAFEVYSLIDPTTSANLNSGKVARKLHEHLIAKKSWESLMRELRQPPFGLYDSLLILFLAGFVARNTDSVSIHVVGVSRACDVDSALLKRMLERPKEYTLRFQPLTEQERRWLRGLVERGLRQPEFTPAPGTTLRAAAAARLKAWVTRQQLPAFAYKLSTDQLASVLEGADAITVDAVRKVLELHVGEGDLATLLLHELPATFGAPAQHEQWTQTTVDELLVRWMAVCDSLARLPALLKAQTLRRVAALFGAETSDDAGVRWNAILRWRLNRGAVQSQQLHSLANELFRLTNVASGSIEENLLDAFSRRVFSVGVEYQRWQDLDRVEKFFAELSKAHAEIERAWSEVALGDDLWREGLARAVSGRNMSGVSAEQVARDLAAWSAGVEWPGCAATLTPTQLQGIYPEQSLEVCQDLRQLVARAGYDEERWRGELQETLPRTFGVQSFVSGEVTAAVRRIETVLPLAASLQTRLRRFVLDRAARLFCVSLDLPVTTPLTEVVTLWRERYAVPEPNDLSSEAKALLFQVEMGAADPETLLLATLPRAMIDVGKPLHQWEQLDLAEIYEEKLRRLINEITAYEPVIAVQFSWLTGLFRAVRQEAPHNPPRERQRLSELVANMLVAWWREQRLPAFVADLSANDLHAMLPQATSATLTAMQLLLRRAAGGAAQVLVLTTIPTSLGLDADPAKWEERAVDQAVSSVAQACRLIESLPVRLRTGLFRDIGAIFAPQGDHVEGSDLLAALRSWRSAYVIMPDDPLSPDARVLYDSLGANEVDAEGLLLQRLPARIAEVKAPYNAWQTWSTRDCYLSALQAAATEIVEHGQVGVGGERADALWQDFCARLSRLNDDERRWVVKTFRDKFQQ